MTFANVPGPPPPPPPPPQYAPPPPQSAPPSGGGGSADNRTIYIVLSYLGLLALIPFLVEKEDREVQWHAKHGLVLTGAELVLVLLIGIVGFVLSFVTSGLASCVLVPFFGLLWIAVLILHVLCIMKGVKGERFLIPGLSDFANRF